MPEKIPEKILVIKLSALGDFILAMGAMEAIRRHHPGAHITLLTTRPFLDIAQRSGYFNDIILDSRPNFYEVQHWYTLFKKLNDGRFVRVYDLQLNKRTSIYYRMFRKKPEWSGLVPGVSLFYSNPHWRNMHAFARHKDMLKLAGIDVQLPDISWMTSDISLLGVKKPYVLLIPGSAPQHPAKRWPAKHYGALALKLAKDGHQPVVLGTQAEAVTIRQIVNLCPAALDLSGKTSLYDIATLARGAAGAIGNDTGPTHLVALSGCPTVALFCMMESRPDLSAPVGRAVQIIEADNLGNVTVADIYTKLKLDTAA